MPASPTSSQPGSAPKQAAGGDTAQRDVTQTPRSGARAAFVSLRHRNFRLYFCGQMISLAGSSMQTIGQAWLVLKLTHSPIQLGLVGALQALPILLFSLFGGVLADRWPKRGVLLVTQCAAMLQALALWLLITSGAIAVWQLYLLAPLLGLTSSLGRPASRAFIVEMVAREDVPNAVALNSSLGTIARIVGPGLAGVIIAASSVTTLFLLNALSFLPVVAALALMRSHELHSQPASESSSTARQTTWQSLREGIGYVWQAPATMHVILVVGFVLLFGSNFNVVLPLFATDTLHQGARAYGFLSAATGLGALASALWLAWRERRTTIRGLLLGMLAFAALEAAFALTPIYIPSLVLIAGVGFAETTFATQAITLLYALTPDRLRGRVMSVQVVLFDGSVPLGYMLLGWLSAALGVSRALLVGAALCLLVAGVGWLSRKPAEQDMAQAAV